MFFTCGMDNFVCYLVDILLTDEMRRNIKTNGDYLTKQGLLVKIHLTMRNWQAEQTRHTDVYFVFCGNTNTFACESKRKAPATIQYQNISNHVSCWRDAVRSYITDIYFRFACEISGDLAPAYMDATCYLSRFNTEHKFVEVDIKARPDNDGSGKKIIVGLR